MAEPVLIRHYIDLIEAAQRPWNIERSPLFDESLASMRAVFPDIKDKLQKFIAVKLEDPLSTRYGKHDRPMTGILVGFWHCHLRDDAILIYNLKNRNVQLVYLCPHSEIEGKHERRTAKRLAVYK